MNAISFYRQLRDVGVDETTACRLAESFSEERERELQELRDDLFDRLSEFIAPREQVHVASAPRSASAERSARYRARRKERDELVESVTEGVTERDEGVTRDAERDWEIPSQERVSHTLPKESPTLPSGDKSPSGYFASAPAREAPRMPDFVEEPDVELVELPAVVDAEFEDVAVPAGAAADLFAEPAPPRQALVPAKPKRASRAAPPLDEAAFDRFWSAYPRKVAKDRARPAFAKACGRIAGPEPPIEVILRGLEASIRFWRNKGTATEYLPHPATWLNDSRWNDEHDPDPGPGTGARQPEQDRRLQQMVGGAQIALDRLRQRQGRG